MSSTNGDRDADGSAVDPARTVGLVRAIVFVITIGGAFVVASAYWVSPVTALLLAALIAIAGWLSAIDFEQRRLPNNIVGPLAIAVTVAVFGAGLVEADLVRSGRAVLVGLASAAFLLVGNLLGGMGMGDVKYAYPLGASLGWFGLNAVFSAGLTMVLVGGLAAIGVLAAGKGRRFRLPYGPFMSIGLLVGLIVSAPGP